MSTRALEIRIDRRACRGSAECRARAPATFSLDAEGKAVVADSPGDEEGAISQAAEACPRFAIHLLRGTERKSDPPARSP